MVSEVREFWRSWSEGKTYFPTPTSGSTGVPKTIQLTREQMKSSARATAKALALKRGYHALVCLPLKFIAGKMMLVRCFETGMKPIVVAPSSNPLETISETERIDFAAFVPLQLQTLLEGDRKYTEQLNRIKAIIAGGAEINPNLEQRIEGLQAPVYATFGMTETVSHIALKRLNGPDRTPYYTALPDIELSVDDRECLIIRGAITNYQQIVTNDRVKLIDNHKFEWLGRADNVINSGGVKVQSEKVEKATAIIFSQLNISSRFFAGGLEDERLGQKVTLFLEGNQLPENIEGNFMKQLQKTLGRYEMPKEIRYLEKFAETETGKIMRWETLKRLKNN